MSWRASGLKAWAIQRFTAIYLALFFCYLLIALKIEPPVDYAAWKSWFASPLMSIATLVFFAALLVHAWVGVRDVFIDYLWQPAVRMTALAIVALVLVACGLWAAQILILARI